MDVNLLLNVNEIQEIFHWLSCEVSVSMAIQHTGHSTKIIVDLLLFPQIYKAIVPSSVVTITSAI